ncbi:FAD/NAD(P)-binding domain-containing protein [Clathrospora elynae]|uniref:FAD/NAD(P)-binding domain-containing protein n=1 Tax=Clathrospora elynae TaxID=706981 RepID=A0A6A5S602_9PLEO|nr:FAD/NAD(P)-binding domain-containing protein [Clathrospora elynae]
MPGRIISRHDVVVVGAGWTGLISAKTYLELAPETDLLIVDNERSIGGVWCTERLYPDLYAQVSYPLFEYSFYDMPKEGITKDGFLSGYTINKYLTSFARDYNLAHLVQLETTITQVDQTLSGAWIITLHDATQIECTKLIWAVGPGSSPVLPLWAQDNFSTPVIHSSDTGKSLERISQVKRATVVGGAKSAFDTVYFLVKAGKEVDWIIREDGGGPIAMGPPTLLGIWNTVDGLSTRAMAMFSPSIMNTSGWWYNAIHRTSIGRLAAKGYWRAANFLADYAAGYSANENFKELRPTPHGFGLFWARAGLGAPSAPDFWSTLHSGKLRIHRSEIESLSHTDVVNLKNDTSVQSDMIIACTGFEKPYRPFSKELRKELGLTYDEAESDKWRKLHAKAEAKIDALLPMLRENPLEVETVKKPPEEVLRGPNRHYRRLIPLKQVARNERSICFPGLVHVIFTPTVSEFQALWNSAYLLGKLDLPSLEDVEEEVATFNVWTKKRHLEMGQKHAYCIFDYLSYIDTLAGDLGIEPRRKSNVLAEMFLRYKPSDYRGMMDEFRMAQKEKKLKVMS